MLWLGNFNILMNLSMKSNKFVKILNFEIGDVEWIYYLNIKPLLK